MIPTPRMSAVDTATILWGGWRRSPQASRGNGVAASNDETAACGGVPSRRTSASPREDGEAVVPSGAMP